MQYVIGGATGKIPSSQAVFCRIFTTTNFEPHRFQFLQSSRSRFTQKCICRDRTLFNSKKSTKYHESFSIQEIFIEERIWSGQKVPNHFTRPFWVTDPGGVYNSAKSEFRDNYQNLIWKRDSEIFKEIIFLDSSVHYLPIFRHFELMLKNCRW